MDAWHACFRRVWLRLRTAVSSGVLLVVARQGVLGCVSAVLSFRTTMPLHARAQVLLVVLATSPRMDVAVQPCRRDRNEATHAGNGALRRHAQLIGLSGDAALSLRAATAAGPDGITVGWNGRRYAAAVIGIPGYREDGQRKTRETLFRSSWRASPGVFPQRPELTRPWLHGEMLGCLSARSHLTGA